jgi:hypothetical protein
VAVVTVKAKKIFKGFPRNSNLNRNFAINSFNGNHLVDVVMGSAVVSPTGSFEAGSYQEFSVTYTAGYFGIDDTGSIKIVHRFASDMGRPQFDNPGAPNYTTVEASNGAVLFVDYDMKRNIRPWDKTL